MTVDTIKTVIKLLIELDSEASTAWEYVNAMTGKKMFAVFTKSQVCDIFMSPSVRDPVPIWTKGKFIGKYAYLNVEGT